ncbi:MAG: peptidoglycan-binding protein [bacterium]|nr:peptidoglycan-binding protein [bacterium]
MSLLRITTAGVAVVAIAGGALWLTSTGEAPATTTTEPAVVERLTDTVSRKTLEHTEEFSGSLGYGDQFALPGQASGTLTAAPAQGAALAPSDELYRVDDRPTHWATGNIPMYRSLGSGSEGADVEQLQRYLQSTGYLSEDAAIDGEFGGGTRAAVKAWQDDHGLKETGRIDSTQLLFLPYESLRVAAVPRVGDFVSGGVLEVTEADLFVTLDASAREKSVFEGKPSIEVQTADGTSYPAAVESITAEQAQDGFGRQSYRIRLKLVGEASQQPGETKVAVIDILASETLAVPARALVALVEGGYAVEVVQPDGTTTYVAVEIGEFADGWVEISGDVTEGASVVVPE